MASGPSAGDSHFYVLKNNTTLFDQIVVAEGVARYSELVTLAAGDTIDFVIGHGPSQLPNALKLQAQLVEVSRLRSEKRSSSVERVGFSFNAGGGTYAIEASSDLRNWTTLTNVVGATGSVKIIDPQSHLHPQRFYRTRLIP